MHATGQARMHAWSMTSVQDSPITYGMPITSLVTHDHPVFLSGFIPSLRCLRVDQTFHPGALPLEPFLLGDEGATRTIVPRAQAVVPTTAGPAVIHVRHLLVRYRVELGLHLGDHIGPREELSHPG